MDIYTLNVVLIIAWAGISHLTRHPKRFFCIVAGVQLALFLGLRDYHTVGIDLMRYYSTYNEIKRLGISQIVNLRSGSNALFYLYTAAFSKANVPYQTYIFIISCICVFSTMWFIYRYSDYPLVGVFIYFGLGIFAFQFSGLKQSLSMAFALFAFDANQQRQNVRTAIFTALAMLFHPVAMVILPWIVLSRFNLTGPRLALSIVVLAIVVLYRIKIGNMVMTIFASEYQGRYEASERIGGTSMFTILSFLLYIYMYYSDILAAMMRRRTGRKIEIDRKELKYTMLYIMLIAAVIQLCSSYAYAFTRLNLYYQLYLIAGYSLILSAPKWKKKFKQPRVVKLALQAFIIAIMTQQYFNQLGGNLLENYMFFWQYPWA